MEYTLGLDLGTTGVRVLLVSRAGQVVSSAASEYPLLVPKPNWAEQDPAEWWQATIEAVRACLKQARESLGSKMEVAAIGLSGQMHGSVFLDGQGKVLRPAILWCDQRTEEQCRQITDIIGFDRLIALTSNRALAGFTAPKILWLKQYEPDNYEKVRKILLPKDYIRYMMTGAFATEVSDASGTLLFDVKGRQWSTEVLSALDIPADWLPACYESPVVSAYLDKEGAELLGLPAGLPVVGGGGDQAAGAVGNGITHAGLASCVLGTSGVVFWHSDLPYCDRQGRLHSFCHAVPGKWHLMGVTLSAGGSLRWFRDALCQDVKAEAEQENLDPYVLIDRMAEKMAEGSEGLLFLPYLAGERTPYADADARGAFVGLSLRHTRAHMARAVMEGVTMSLKDCMEIGLGLGLYTTSVRLSGGGARSGLWQQMAADIFGLDVARMGADEGPAYGAAILAAVGGGFYQSVEQACDKLIHVRDAKIPGRAGAETYKKLYGIYGTLYNELKGFFERDAALVADISQ